MVFLLAYPVETMNFIPEQNQALQKWLNDTFLPPSEDKFFIYNDKPIDYETLLSFLLRRGAWKALESVILVKTLANSDWTFLFSNKNITSSELVVRWTEYQDKPDLWTPVAEGAPSQVLSISETNKSDTLTRFSQSIRSSVEKFLHPDGRREFERKLELMKESLYITMQFLIKRSIEYNDFFYYKEIKTFMQFHSLLDAIKDEMNYFGALTIDQKGLYKLTSRAKIIGARNGAIYNCLVVAHELSHLINLQGSFENTYYLRGATNTRALERSEDLNGKISNIRIYEDAPFSIQSSPEPVENFTKISMLGSYVFINGWESIEKVTDDIRPYLNFSQPSADTRSRELITYELLLNHCNKFQQTQDNQNVDFSYYRPDIEVGNNNPNIYKKYNDLFSSQDVAEKKWPLWLAYAERVLLRKRVIDPSYTEWIHKYIQLVRNTKGIGNLSVVSTLKNVREVVEGGNLDAKKADLTARCNTILEEARRLQNVIGRYPNVLQSLRGTIDNIVDNLNRTVNGVAQANEVGLNDLNNDMNTQKNNFIPLYKKYIFLIIENALKNKTVVALLEDQDEYSVQFSDGMEPFRVKTNDPLFLCMNEYTMWTVSSFFRKSENNRKYFWSKEFSEVIHHIYILLSNLCSEFHNVFYLSPEPQGNQRPGKIDSETLFRHLHRTLLSYAIDTEQQALQNNINDDINFFNNLRQNDPQRIQLVILLQEPQRSTKIAEMNPLLESFLKFMKETCIITKETELLLYKKQYMPTLCSFLCIRPFIRVKTKSAVYFEEGAGTIIVAYPRSFMEVDNLRSNITFQYTQYIGNVIQNPRKVLVIPNVSFHGYISGYGSEIIDTQEKFVNVMNGQDKVSSMIVCLLDPDVTESEMMKKYNPFSLSNDYEAVARVYNVTSAYTEQRNGPRGYDFYRQFFDIDSESYSTENNFMEYKNSSHIPLCLLGKYYTYNENTRKYDTLHKGTSCIDEIQEEDMIKVLNGTITTKQDIMY